MDATQRISDSILESDDEENEQESENKKRQPLAKLHILKNQHIPETELPLFAGDNVLGRDPKSCTLSLPAPSISKQHATIGISVYRRRGSHSELDIEALVWDLGSMNGTRKGHIKLTPNVRYALSDGDSLVVADIPCQYVSCAVNTVSSQEDLRTPVNIKLGFGVKTRLPDAAREKSGDTSIGSKKCVNGDLEARMSLMHTSDKTSCLSFEQTPTQPQKTLVPESDSDSDDERRGQRALVSDSDLHNSSPGCSTFLSPTNKIVPESEDESPITPSSSTKNRPNRDVSLNKEETNLNVGQQQQMIKDALTFVDESEEEEGKEEQRVIPGGTETNKNGQHPAARQESIVSLTGDKRPVPTPDADAMPVFNMESDTDTEGEEEGVSSASPVRLDQVTQPPHLDQFHMDCDTDDEDALHRVLKTVPSCSDNTRPPHVASAIQPEGVTVNSDTDVDDDAAVSDAATEAKPVSFQSAHIAESSTQPKDFNLDSDTDVDEEIEGREYGINELSNTADAGAELNIHTDSDTDVDDDSPLVIPVAVTNLSMSCANVSDSDPNTDVDESNVPSARDVDNQAECKVNSGTAVENNEAAIQEPGEDQIPNLCNEKTSGMLPPLLQNCSTPVHVSEEVANLETQAFLSPSSLPIRPLSCSDSQEDEDVVVAETQSFILPTRKCQGNPPDDHINEPIQALDAEHSDDEKDSSDGACFQLGLSESSHLQCQPQVLAMESTQVFIPADPNVEDILTAISTSDRTSAEYAPTLEATQDFEKSEELGRCSAIPENKGHVELALEATQAYISGVYSDSEDECDKDETENTDAQAECPTSSTLAMAETQPMSAFEDEEIIATDKPASPVQVRSTTQKETEESKESGAVLQTNPRPFIEALSIAETQPMENVSDEDSDDESDDKDSFSGPRRRKAKPLQLEEEQTQLLTISETQPMSAFEDEEIIATNKPASPVQVSSRTQKETEERKESGAVLHTNHRPFSEVLSIAQTQPMDNISDDESDDKNSFSGPRRRKAKPLQLEEEQTQPLTVSETQPMQTGVCETQHLATTNDGQPERIRERGTEAGTSGVTFNKGRTLEKLNEQEQAKCSDIPKEGRKKKLEAEKKKLEAEKRELELKTLEMERKEQECQERVEREERERLEKERQEQQENLKKQNKPGGCQSAKVPARGRRAAKRTIPTQPEQDPASLTDDVPARRTRSRSNSSNSVSSERSASNINTQDGRGRGQGRGAKRASEPPDAVVSRSSNRRRTAAIGSSQQESSPPGHCSRSNSSSSLNSEVSSCSVGFQVRGRGGRQRGRGRKTEPVSIPSVISPGKQSSTCKPATRGQRGKKEEESSNAVLQKDDKEKADSQLATTTRRRQQASGNVSEPAVQKVRRGRASSAQGKKNAREIPPDVELQEEGEKIEVETVETREKGRLTAAQNKKKKVQEGNAGMSASSMSQDAKVATAQPQTPSSTITRKRQAPSDCSPVAKTPRRSSASPAASGRLRAASQSYKVLFTGVVDEAGERVLVSLGGSMAKGVADMNCLVTDKVRRTVKFLCAVAKGIPIVTTHWLEKSGKAGSFLPPDAFMVKDPEQEKKFSFSLQDSLRTASSQPLLQGYEIHVTKSVKPEPVQMKDIIACSGATFLPRMPSSHKPQTVVISCEEDWLLCAPAVSASLPVFTAEFILTGILQQKLDWQCYILPAPTAIVKPTGGRGRSRKKT